MILLATMAAGGIGAVSRVILGRKGRPAITAINVFGAATLGLVVGLGASGRLSPDVVAVGGLGFLGGFTTFSTWMVDAATTRDYVASIGLPAVAGIAAAALGQSIGAL